MTRQTAGQTQQTPTTSPLSRGGILQRQCASCGQHTIANGECTGCHQKGLILQRRAINSADISDASPWYSYPSRSFSFHQDFSHIPIHSSVPNLIQPKLTVGTIDDYYEQEADRIADQVMNIHKPVTPQLLQQPSTPEGESLQSKASLQYEKNGGFQSKGHLQKRLNHSQGSGNTLPNKVRSFMELRFGRDFSQVRVHTDDAASQMNQELNAQAFTYGSDIYFGAGKCPAISHLTAHELAHTVQQGAGDMQLSKQYIIQRSSHRVAAKETLTSIATQYNVSVSAICEANDIQPSASLPLNKLLTIPDGKPFDHTVTAGQTLFSIGQMYNASVDDIKTINSLSSDEIKVGQVLKIPVEDESTFTRYQVKPGDTLSSISQAHGVTVQDIQAANAMKSTNTTIQEGEELKIPKSTPSSTPSVGGKTGSVSNPKATGTKVSPSASPSLPPTPSKPAVSIPSSSSSDPGHNPGMDYSEGKIRERSFLRNADKKTIQKSNSKPIFFHVGEKVKLVSADKDWIEVQGQAFAEGTPLVKVGNKKGWIQRNWTTMSLGDYKDLGIEDISGTYGKLSADRLPKSSVNNVILHQTGSQSGTSTLSDYEKRINAKSTISAQYLIDENGKINLVVPVDQKVSHVGKTKKGFETASSSHSVGIEHVGMAKPLDMPSSNKDSTTLTANREEIQKMPISPQLKARLLGLSDADLFNIAKANHPTKDTKWYLYGDISAKQKRSSYLLSTRLMSDFSLHEDDFLAHETVSWKTVGEGENIKEFLTARTAYPQLVTQLESTINSNSKLKSDASLAKILNMEKATVEALAKDATEAENKALESEKKSGKLGAASARKAIRTKFYDKFWVRQTQLQDLLTFLKTPNASNPADLSKKTATWIE